jgi:hypothetical protein
MALTAYHTGIIDMAAAMVILPADARPRPERSKLAREVDQRIFSVNRFDKERNVP